MIIERITYDTECFMLENMSRERIGKWLNNEYGGSEAIGRVYLIDMEDLTTEIIIYGTK